MSDIYTAELKSKIVGIVPVSISEVLPVSISGGLSKYVVLANALAITDTSLHTFDLISLGLTEEEIRQYREFKISIVNSHNQGPTTTLRTSFRALSASAFTSASVLYTDPASLTATSGRLILHATIGGTGTSGSQKVVPALKGVHSNLFVDITFAVAPTSGSITIGVEMNA